MPPRESLSRRRALTRIGVGLAALPFTRFLVACGDNAASTADAGPEGADAMGSGSATGTWATGGTASMSGQADYPQPFVGGAPTACTLMCEATLGPCYDSKAETIQDISYGQLGLPMRMWFQVVDDTCAPVAGVTVDVWHVAPTGKYSGDDAVNENIPFCTASDTVYTSALFFRGKQVTDGSGLVSFDTCFPGWYSSRTVHVHFVLTVNGQSTLTSQLVFADALDDAIISTQPIYKDRGARDTTNETDTVISASDVAAYSFNTQQMRDGAMLAWKTLVIRKSSTEASCALAGGGGGPPPGGSGSGSG